MPKQTIMSTLNINTCYGMEADEDRLVIVKTTRTRGGFQQEVLVEGPLSMGWKQKAESVVLAAAMPVSSSFVRWIQTPLGSISKARKVLPSLLDIQLPFPLETCAYQFPIIRKTGSQQVSALAVAAPEPQVIARLEALKPLGLDPMILDHEGLALWDQSLHEIPLGPRTPRITACIQARRITLVLGESGDLVGAHSIRQGSLDLAGGAEENLQRVVARVRQIVQARGTGNSPSIIQWIWTGPGADQPELIRALETRLKELHPFQFSSHKAPSSFLARALGRRALDPRPCNLLQGKFAHPEQALRMESTRRRVYAQGLAAGLLLCAINLGWAGLLQVRLQQEQTKISTLASRLSGMPRVPKGQEILLVQRALEQQDTLLRPFQKALQPSLSIMLNRLLGLAFQHQLSLDELSLHPTGWELQGFAPDWESGEKIVGDLAAEGITATLSRQDPGADERVPFTLQGGLSHETP